VTELVDDEDRGAMESHSAMRDLLDDCYTRVFITRDGTTQGQREYMEMQLHAGKSLEGLVSIIVKQWVEKRHAIKDPRDSAIFNNLREALREMVGDPDSQLIVIKGPGSRFDHETILGIPESAPNPIDRQTVISYIGSDSAWQEVFNQVTRYQKLARQLIKTAVQGMVNDDQLPFYFIDLLSAIKERCSDPTTNLSLNTQVLYDQENDSVTTIFRTIDENEGYKTKEDDVVEKFRLTRDGINQSNRRDPIKERLHKLLDLLEHHCFEKKTDLTENVLGAISQELGIGKTTIYDDMQRLREYYESAREQTEE